MIDIHCHIMPGVDDGADNYEESLAMAREAFAAGTNVMVVTPHYYNSGQMRFEMTKADVIQRFQDLQAYFAENGCPVRLCIGAEHFGVQNIGRLAEENRLIPINGSRYVLVEFDFDDEHQRVRYVLSQLISAGYVPVVAHPERYYFLQREPELVYDYLEKGCLLQVNKGSPLGRYGEEEKRLAMWLLNNRLPHVIASDCHSPYQRTPDMSDLHEEMCINVSERYAKMLFIDNPLKILRNEHVV